MNCVEDNIGADANQQIWRKMVSVTQDRPANARMSEQEKADRTPSNHEDEISDRNRKLARGAEKRITVSEPWATSASATVMIWECVERLDEAASAESV